MRKIKLQMQMSLDGYVAGPNSEMDWMEWNWDDALKNFVSELTSEIDTILLGRKLADGFIPHWKSVSENNNDPDLQFGKIMYLTPKIVFSKTVHEQIWDHTTVINTDMSTEVNRIKKLEGKDIMVYGGANFVSNLIKENLIDELFLFVNPTAIGTGMKIFDERTNLILINSVPFDCGIVVNCYKPTLKT